MQAKSRAETPCIERSAPEVVAAGALLGAVEDRVVRGHHAQSTAGKAALDPATPWKLADEMPSAQSLSRELVKDAPCAAELMHHGLLRQGADARAKCWQSTLH